jgi:hypothetical protein
LRKLHIDVTAATSHGGQQQSGREKAQHGLPENGLQKYVGSSHHMLTLGADGVPADI